MAVVVAVAKVARATTFEFAQTGSTAVAAAVAAVEQAANLRLPMDPQVAGKTSLFNLCVCVCAGM